MKVFVYYNLHKKCFSIKALTGEQKGRVIAHADAVVLNDVEFKVSESGRQRVLKERRKNVHAGVAGFLVSFSILNGEGLSSKFNEYTQLSTLVTYDPYKYNTFVNKKTLEPILNATRAYLIDKKVFI